MKTEVLNGIADYAGYCNGLAAALQEYADGLSDNGKLARFALETTGQLVALDTFTQAATATKCSYCTHDGPCTKDTCGCGDLGDAISPTHDPVARACAGCGRDRPLKYTHGTCSPLCCRTVSDSAREGK